MPGPYSDHPFDIDGRGRIATTELEDHVRDMIFQILFTNPGERVNRPDFGCGLLQMVFMPNSEALATATQFLVHGALQRWLSDVIKVDTVEITAENEQLVVRISYTLLVTGQKTQTEFTAPV
jgi:phage baseplate assembly protein W